MIMRTLKTLSIFIVLTLSYRCGSPFDISGKGAKTECFFLDTGSLKVIYDCSEKKISQVIVYENTSSKQSFGRLLYRKTLDEPVKEFALPFQRDSIKNKFIQVELHLTDTHFRESYYIDIAPGDLEKKKIVYSRHFGH